MSSPQATLAEPPYEEKKDSSAGHAMMKNPLEGEQQDIVDAVLSQKEHEIGLDYYLAAGEEEYTLQEERAM